MDPVFYHFATLDSTNTWAKDNLYQFDPENLILITADKQTKGYGRFGRSWISPPHKNIHATFCFTFPKARIDAGNIPQVMALAVVDTLKTFALNPKMKWPNDILVSRRKIAGILCETKEINNQLWIVLGVGINVNMSREEGEQISQPATSIAIETNEIFSIQEVLNVLTSSFQRHLAQFLQNGFFLFSQQLQSCLIHELGDILEISNQFYKFERVDEEGALWVKTDKENLKKIVSGEIVIKT